MNIVSKFFQHNWLAILWFNFRMLPLRQAVKLPFDFYHHVRFEHLQGRVIIDAPNVWRGMIKIGGRGSEMFALSPAIIDLRRDSLLSFKGVAEIGNGCLLRVEEKATLTLGKKVRLGASTKVICEERITLGDEVGISWESQLFDTNFHFMQVVATGERTRKTAPIVIGSYNWIGNRVNIMKGTHTPDHAIVASNSMLNKDYTNSPPFPLLAGMPAKVIKSGVKRMFEGVDL